MKSVATTDSVLDEIAELAPLDEHNRTLASNVHPTDWQNPQPTGRYNLVVIGAGTAGLVTAAGAAGLGAKVAMIERKLMGGDCLNVGCVPSKALLRASRAAADVRDAGQFGIEVPDGVQVNFPAIMERMRRLRAQISSHDSAKRFSDLGVDVFIGSARFTGPDTVEVGGQTLAFSKAVIATGARAAEVPINGLKETGYLTNETVFSLTDLPPRLAVIGAGPIGCELSQAFARFGNKVYLIEAMHGIMPNEDQDAAEIVKQSMFRDGIQLMCCGKSLEISKTDDGKRLTVDSHGQHYDLTVVARLDALSADYDLVQREMESWLSRFNRRKTSSPRPFGERGGGEGSECRRTVRSYSRNNSHVNLRPLYRPVSPTERRHPPETTPQEKGVAPARAAPGPARDPSLPGDRTAERAAAGGRPAFGSR